MFLDLSHDSLPRMLRSGVLVEPGTRRPRYWPVVWCAIYAGDLAESTLLGKLRAIETLYQHAEALYGLGSLDDAIGCLDHEMLAKVLESWFVSIRNKHESSSSDEIRWQTGLGFVTSIVKMLSGYQAQAVNLGKIEERLHRLNQLYRQLHIKKKTKSEIIRSLPESVGEAMYSSLDPLSLQNPFSDPATRWRVFVAFILMLHQGLRRGEMLLLPVDCIKSTYDKKLGRERYWLNVKNNEYEDEDTRYSKPSIKTASSIRQIPVSVTVANCVQVYVENYRGRPSHSFLLNSKRNMPLATESLTKAFAHVSSTLPASVLSDLENRTGKTSVTPHDLRHTCAVIRLHQLLNHGDSMDEALQKLRTFFGWAKNSVMPARYARAVFEDRLSSIWNDTFDDRVALLRSIPKGSVPCKD
ncbi:site-specific integrase [Chromobacterium sp. S0633]|uniref:site-specific integrase n=1 Tax=Chromobacterium sp. S0633 TaxID=2957805 RepID=UPI00209D11EC|nr:site-specific integrase [Chromobacterium sp. S0633]MCP1290344.1 site-specific integrase [Chromobacterium sp. S0633]